MRKSLFITSSPVKPGLYINPHGGGGGGGGGGDRRTGVGAELKL